MKIQIEKIYRNKFEYNPDPTAEKVPLVSKFGKPYEKITVVSDGVKYYLDDYTGYSRGWQDGQEIEVEVTKTDKGYNKIVLPKKENITMDRLIALEQRVSNLEHIVGNRGTLEFKKKDVDFKGASALSQADSGGDLDTELPF